MVFVVLRGVFALLAIAVLGLLVTGWTIRRHPFRSLPARLAFAYLIGAAVMTWLLIVYTELSGRLSIWPVYILIAVLLPGWRRAWQFLITTSDTADLSEKPSSFSRWEWLLAAMIAASILIVIERLLLVRISWDGYAQWQLRAKAFFLDGDFSILGDPAHYVHLDYPLLVPLNAWWVYAHLGAVNDHWSQVIGLVFYLDLLALFGDAALAAADRTYALAALAIVASAPVVIKHAASGYADIEFAVYFLGLAIALTWWLKAPTIERFWAPAWMIASIVLVKNEGLLAAAGSVWTTFIFARHSRLKSAPLIASAVGFLPWVVARWHWRLSTPLLHAIGPRLLNWPVTLSRLLRVTTEMIIQAARIGPAYPAWGLFLLLAVTGVLMWWKHKNREALMLAWLVVIQFAGYSAIITLAPYSVHALLISTSDRLTLHLFPAILLIALMSSYSFDAAAARLPAESEGAA
ncbi:MAG: hypothetical protein M1330_00470 [Armatimonadetes bacterium]|nr:hypothetical protein [Armatimonadota bacterium]